MGQIERSVRSLKSAGLRHKQHRVLAKYNMPHVLEYWPPNIIMQVGLEKPLKIHFIVAFGPGEHLIVRDCKLRATSNADSSWHIVFSEYFLCYFIFKLRCSGNIFRVAERLNLVWTARSRNTTKIYIFIFLDGIDT